MNSSVAAGRSQDGAQSQSTVLLPIHTGTFFIELFRVAKLLQTSRSFRPIVLFGWKYPTQDADVERCEAAGIAYRIDPPPAPPSSEAGESQPAPVGALGADQPRPAVSFTLRAFRVLRRIAAKLKRAPRSCVSRLFAAVPMLDSIKRIVGSTEGYYVEYHRHRKTFADRMLRDLKVDLLVMGGDMPGYDTADFIAAAHDLGIKVALVPSTMSNGLEQAEAYYHNPQFRLLSIENLVAAWRYPRWLRVHRGRRLLRRPGGDISAMERLGTAPPAPWMFNSGFADVVCVESEAMLQYGLEGGLAREKLATTGSPADDVLAEQVRTADVRRPRLLSDLGLDPQLPVILVALPPDFLYLEGGRPECDFRHYSDLVTFWHDTLRSLAGVNVVLSLHPSVDPETHRYLETARIKIGPPNTAALIPLCDVFVASVSSTIRWAIASGKPVLNYDVYRYRYTDYLGVPGVLLVEEQADFTATLRRLADDPMFRAEITRRQESAAAHWGRLDGQAGRRMMEVFESLIERKSPAKAAA